MDNPKPKYLTERHFLDIIDFLPDATFVIDTSGRLIAWNKAMVEMTGIEEKEVLGKGDYEYALPFYGKRRPTLVDIVLEPDDEIAQNYPFLDRDGESLTTEVATPFLTREGDAVVWAKARRLYNTQGEIIGAIESVRDITERKQAEEVLRESEERVRSIIDTALDAVITIDAKGVIIGWNTQAEVISGWSRQEAIGEFIHNTIIPYRYRDAHQRGIEHYFKTGEGPVLNQRIEIVARHRNGHEFPIELEISPLKAGKTVTFSAFVRDITSHKQIEQQAQKSLARRKQQIQISAEISQHIAAGPTLKELFNQAVNLIRDRFDYYHVCIYSLKQDSLVIQAGTGEAGREKQRIVQTIPVTAKRNLAASVVQTGEPTLVIDVSQIPDWVPNPWLPNTKTEIAVPLRLGNSILGVLDVQNDTAGGLDEEDQLLLMGLGAQIASAIANTRLLAEQKQSEAELEARVQEVEALQRLMRHEGWQEYQNVSEGTVQGYVYNQNNVRPARPADLDTSVGNDRSFTRPVAVHDEVIGTIGVYHDDQNQPLSSEDQVFLESIAEQVAEALERARLLEQTHKRAVELEAVAQMGTVAATTSDVESLLQTVVDLTKSSFGLYHAHIYLLNISSASHPLQEEVLHLSAGAGEVGREMVRHGWRIPLDKEDSIVAQAARTQQGVIANDVKNRPDFVLNPLLPNTRSELAVPLVSSENVLGVLAVQADVVNYFSEEDVQIQITLASQVAAALQNARLYQQTQDALNTVEATQRRYTMQAWESYRAKTATHYFEQVREGVTLLDNELPVETNKAVADKQTMVVSSSPRLSAGQEEDGNSQTALSPSPSGVFTPLTSRGEVIGVVGLQETDERQWTPEEIALVEAIAEQMAQAAENIRLIDETQQRAAREKRVNEIGDKIQATQSLEEALQIAVKEVGLSLQAPQTTVRLDVE